MRGLHARAGAPRAIAVGVFALAACAAIVALPGEAGAQTAGINMGAPVWNGVFADDALAASIATGAPHIRVNFRLDNWTSPADTTKHGGLTFFEAYDKIVDAITSQGLEVYALLNDELAPGLAVSSPAFETAYTANALAVIERYKNRVRVWETINEPNNWDETQNARLSPATFARLHGRLYDAVKVQHPGDACWNVKLVTGPLFSFDDVSAANYLEDAIVSGRAGGAWKGVFDALGHDPVDDVGYHVYVAQGTDSPLAAIGARAGANLNALRGVLNARGLGDKKVWLSEIGYRASVLTDAGQAERLDATFGALGARSDVASIQWFTIADFAGETWGLFGGAFDAANRRTAHDHFVAQAKAYAPALAARIELTLPKQLAAGSKVIAKVKVTNLGKTVWSKADGVRLGAAAGCPAASATNGWRWDLPADGYVTSATDARAYLAASAAIAQGDSVVINVPLTAPATIGKQRLAVRMVREGVAWFGATGVADVEITAAPITAPGGSTDSKPAGTDPVVGPGEPEGVNPVAPEASGAPNSAGGCGCRAIGGVPTSNVGGVLLGLAIAGAIAGRRQKARKIIR